MMLRACLASLEGCRDLWDEVIVVDNASPDDAAEEALGREGVRVAQSTLGPSHPYTRGFVANLVWLYEAWGKKDEAAKWRKEQAKAATKP